MSSSSRPEGWLCRGEGVIFIHSWTCAMGHEAFSERPGVIGGSKFSKTRGLSGRVEGAGVGRKLRGNKQGQTKKI